MIIETHCHLDYLESLKLQEILELSQKAQIQKIITIGVDPENLDKVKLIADENEMIYYTQGIHPHDSKLATQVEFDKMSLRSLEKKMVAIGEIGLDYHYDNSPREIQREVFEKQLQLSIDHHLPVVIHTREAEEDTRSILKNFPQVRGVVHSFTSSRELAEFVLSQGFFLGFNGIITFKKAESVQEVVKLTPVSQLLFETDSPFLTPVPHRGKENAPYYLPWVVSKISELKNIPEDELKPIVFENSLRCFPKLNHQV